LLLLERHPVRPCSCSLLELRLAFTAVTRVQIPSGTPNLINGLEEIVLFPAGTKRHKFHPNSAALLRNHQCFRGCRAYSYRHKKAQLKTAPSAADSICANQTDYITLRLALVKCDCLGVSVQSDAARRVPEQFLHHFDIRPRCPSTVTNRCGGTYAIQCVG